MLSHDYPELNGELSNRLAGLFKELLEQERRSVTGASDDRQCELLEKIERRETELNDDEELDEWKDELDELKNQPIDKPLIFNSAKNKAMSLLQHETRVADLLPEPLESKDGEEKGKEEKKKGGGKKAFEQAKETIQLMKEGKHYGDAFRLVAEKWSVTRHAVQWKCTGVLGIKNQQFIKYVDSGRIIQIMKEKYPQQIELIERELEPLFPRLADSANDTTRSLANSAA